MFYLKSHSEGGKLGSYSHGSAVNFNRAFLMMVEFAETQKIKNKQEIITLHEDDKMIGLHDQILERCVGIAKARVIAPMRMYLYTGIRWTVPIHGKSMVDMVADKVIEKQKEKL